MGYNTLLSLLTLMPKWSLIWWQGTPSRWLLCPFDVSLSFFVHFLIFWYKIVQVHLILSFIQSWNQPLFWDAFLSWKIVFGSQIWALGIDNAIVVLLLPDSLEASFTYFYSHAYKHTQYSQILYLYLYLSGHEFTLLYSKQHHKIHSSFLPSHICNNLW